MNKMKNPLLNAIFIGLTAYLSHYGVDFAMDPPGAGGADAPPPRGIFGKGMQDALGRTISEGGKPAIVIVDTDNWAVDIAAPGKITGMERVIKYAAKNNLPILDIQIGDGGNDDVLWRTLGVLMKAARASDGYVAYLKDGVYPASPTRVFKDAAPGESGIGGWKSVDFRAELEAMDVDTFFVMGYADSCCVLETTKTLLDYGYAVQVERPGLNISRPYARVYQSNQEYQRLKEKCPDKFTEIKSEGC